MQNDYNTNNNSSKAFGLIDLFGSRRLAVSTTTSATTSSSTNRGSDGGGAAAAPANDRLPVADYAEEPFFTFRMEHREGGSVAQHYGEERILLFRSDQRGAIGKIIFSSIPTSDDDDDDSRHNNNTPPEVSCNNMMNFQRMAAQAKVHVLSVREKYRGYDLGGLLFTEAMTSLRHRYHHDKTEGGSSSVRCQLDAEEDIRRHNKLVYFYQQLGCQVKPKAKINYINNNDGETYRKIPMQISLNSRDVDTSSSGSSSSRHHKQLQKNGSLINFLPVVFFSAHHKRASMLEVVETKNKEDYNKQNWLAVETGEGMLQFRSTTGLTLAVDKNGHCTAKAGGGGERDRNSNFRLLRFSDMQVKLLDRKDTLFESEEESSSTKDARQKELWMIKSMVDGLFLVLDPMGHFLTCSPEPAFWQADDHNLSLMCTRDTPQRRQHYRKLWTNQTVQYVLDKKERYLQFAICEMSIKQALDIAKTVRGENFSVDQKSLRSLLVSQL